MLSRKYLSLLILIIPVGYFLLPDFIHNLIYKTTDESAISKTITEYNRISIELNVSDSDVKSKISLATRDSLYLWLHVRGISINEGHIPISTHEKWSELNGYYFPK